MHDQVGLAVFPFPAIVAQEELKLALLLVLVNPAIGGVLLQGPYGVGKTTAVRSLLDLLPPVEQPVCERGCRADDPAGQCADCRERVSKGQALTLVASVRLIELPLTARIEDVVGGVNERVALEQRRVLLEPGVLATAHNNLLYVDEVNLLDPPVVDAILDAAAQGRTFVRRGPMVRLFPSRFVLIGSMNPEEGRLRPQIMDRFGLRVWVGPVAERPARLAAARHVRAFSADPEAFRARFDVQTAALARLVAAARTALPAINPTTAAEETAIALVDALQIPSHRAEITMLEAARAHAALAARDVAEVADIEAVALLTLRQRHSPALAAAAERVGVEDAALRQVMNVLLPS
ncbi:MAG: ATP-binding protein [Herpetosiphonaceae bacterium]|nr:ATP-binding protein [Herpetosiphonaceae bacterium]